MKICENGKFFYIGVFSTKKGAEYRKIEINRKEFYSVSNDYIDSKCKYQGEKINVL